MAMRVCESVFATCLAWAFFSQRGFADESLDTRALAARIDQRLEEKWQAIKPTSPADNAEFCRRVHLDLTGRIPRVIEVRDFLDDPATDKRTRLVENLLASPRYVEYFSVTWQKIMLPAPGNQELAAFATNFRNWLRTPVRNNVPYDALVREIISAKPRVENPEGLKRAFGDESASGSANAFFFANEGKAENLAASTARVFMGIRLECAQCHNHPSGRWTRSQFWELAAFFSPPSSQGKPALLKAPIKIPGSETIVEPRFPTGQKPGPGADSHLELARWLTASDNPYFARTAVNRIWAHFFGTGLIDPVDDEPTPENPLSHPELLSELSDQFISHGCDVKYLIRALTATRAYQRSSKQTDIGQSNPRAFARMALRGMNAEQLFDSIALATGFKESSRSEQMPPNVLGGPRGPRDEFINRFAGQERSTEKQTTILHALALMNGDLIADATNLERSATLAAVADVPFLSAEAKLETLYLATLSRLPTKEESSRLLDYVNSGGPRQNQHLALSDVFWALLNSSEFASNH